MRKRLDEVRSHPLFSHFTRLTIFLQQRRLNHYLSGPLHTETRFSKLDAPPGPDGCILNDTLPTKYLAMCKILSSPSPLEPSFGSVDLTEPGKHQWEPSKSGCLNWAVGRLLVKGEAMDKVENSTIEIGSGDDLRRALHAVDVVKGKLIALVGQQHANDHNERVVDNNQMEE